MARVQKHMARVKKNMARVQKIMTRVQKNMATLVVLGRSWRVLASLSAVSVLPGGPREDPEGSREWLGEVSLVLFFDGAAQEGQQTVKQQCFLLMLNVVWSDFWL